MTSALTPPVTKPASAPLRAETVPRADGVDWKRWGAWMWPLALYGLLLVWLSDGNYHNDDTLHYLCARNAWVMPHLFLGIWARPGFTVPYAFVAWIGESFTGLFCCRLLSLAIVIAVAALTTATAKRLRIPNAEWAGLITLLIPLHFQLSVTTLTETICSLYLIAGTWLFISDRPRLSALVLSLTMLTRHEAIFFVAGGALLFCWRREWLAALLLGTSELAWNLVSVWTNAPERPWTRYLPSSDLGYGSAGPLWGVVMWIEAVGPVAIMLTLWGSFRLLRGAGLELSSSGAVQDLRSTILERGVMVRLPTWLDGRKFSTVAIGRWLVVIGALGLVPLQTLLFMFNKFASGGYARFLVPAAPWMGLCILHGLNAAVPWLLHPGMHTGDPAAWVRRSLRIGLLVVPFLALAVFYAYPHRPSIAGMFTFFYALVLFGVACGLTAVGKWRRSPRLLGGAVFGFAAAWAGSWAGGALPLVETPTQRLHGEACRWIRERPAVGALPVACLSPVGTLYTDQWRLLGASIWTAPSPGRPILVIDDKSVWYDAPLQARLKQLSFTELRRFRVESPEAGGEQSDVVVYRAEFAPEVVNTLNDSVVPKAFPGAAVSTEADAGFEGPS